MQYFKRVFVLIILIVFSFVNNQIRPEVSTHFTVTTMSFFLINIIFVITMIVGSLLIKNVPRTKPIIASESFILLFLLLVSFLPQIDNTFGLEFSKVIQFNAENIGFMYSIQLIWGYYLLTFVMILQNPKTRRGGTRGTIRYMG